MTTVPTRRSVLAGALSVSALGGAALAPGEAHAALDDPQVPSAPEVSFFLAVDGIAGASTVRGFERQVELLTWAWGVDVPVGTGGGGSAGRPAPRELVTLARTDVQSPLLLLAAHTGRLVRTVTLSAVRRPRRPTTFLTVKLEEVQVTGYAVTPDPTDGLPCEVVRLACRKITHTVVPQNPDGSAGTPVTSSFDYAVGSPG